MGERYLAPWSRPPRSVRRVLTPGSMLAAHLRDAQLNDDKRVNEADDVLSVGQKVQRDHQGGPPRQAVRSPRRWLDPDLDAASRTRTEQRSPAPDDGCSPSPEGGGSRGARLPGGRPPSGVSRHGPGRRLHPRSTTTPTARAIIMRMVPPCDPRAHGDLQRSVSVGFLGEPGPPGTQHRARAGLHPLPGVPAVQGHGPCSSLEIAEAFNRVGGESNAFTSHQTRAHPRPGALRGAAHGRGMSSRTCSRRGAVEPIDERGADPRRRSPWTGNDPTDFALSSSPSRFPRLPARPIAGTPEEIRSEARDAVWEHYRGAYRPENLVVTVAGGLEHENGGPSWSGVTGPVAGSGHRRGSGCTLLPTTPARLTPSAARGRTVRWSRPTWRWAGPGCSPATSVVFTHDRAERGPGRRHVLPACPHDPASRRAGALTFSFSGSYSDAGFFRHVRRLHGGPRGPVTGLMRDELDRLARTAWTPRSSPRWRASSAGPSVLALEDTGLSHAPSANRGAQDRGCS
ncbi:hypothetical protein QJS66_06625 [Kocuria rhizophila]|nr:hypothetical protein QJS66_06625 [Kocuria rhizophila]